MPGIFDTSATELANYTGNLSAALGGSYGGDSGATAIYGESDATEINQAIKDIGTLNFQKNKDRYDAQVKDLADLKDHLVKQDLPLPQMLPNDRDRLLKDYRDPIRKILLDNPDITTNPKKFKLFTEMQGMVDNFKEAKAYAGVRLKAVGDLDDAIGKETDPERKQRMILHRNDIYGQDLFGQVKPFQEALDWTPTIFANPGVVEENPVQTVEGDKIVTSKRSYTPLADFEKQVNFNYIDSPNKSLKNQMDQFGASFDQLPTDIKKRTVDQWNDAIQKANSENGLKEGDKGYVMPISATVVPGTDGQPGGLFVDATVPQKVLAQSILNNYRNIKTREEKISDLPSKIKENNAQANKADIDAWAKKQDALKLPYEINKLKAETAKNNADAYKARIEAKAKADEVPDSQKGDYYLNQTLNLFDPKMYEGSTKIPEGIAAKLGFPPNLQGKIVSYVDESGNQHSDLNDAQMLALGQRFKIEGKTSVLKPSTVIFNPNNSKDPYFIATYEISSGGKTRTETRIIRSDNAAENLIKNVNGEDNAGTENKDNKLLRSAIKRRTGGKERLNGNEFRLLDDPAYKGSNDALEEAWGK